MPRTGRPRADPPDPAPPGAPGHLVPLAALSRLRACPKCGSRALTAGRAPGSLGRFFAVVECRVGCGWDAWAFLFER